MGLFIEVAYRGDWWGEDPIHETEYETTGDLFRALSGRDRTGWSVEPLGRCTGKVYIDNVDGVARQVGWVFEARNPDPVRRGDEQPTGLRIAWVTVHEQEPTVKRTVHYASFRG